MWDMEFLTPKLHEPISYSKSCMCMCTYMYEYIHIYMGFPYVYGFPLVAQMVKNTPPMQETWVRSLGWEEPLEKGMATHSSIFA